jgi:hypothetical protein
MALDWAVGNRHIWSRVIDHVTQNGERGVFSSGSCLFVLGASGIGKSYHIKRLLEDYEVYSIDATNCANHREFRDMVIKGCNPHLMTRTQTTKPYAIFMDDMDILCHMDRMIMSTLFDLLKGTHPLTHVPMICVGSLDMEKKLGNMKGKCGIITCTAPSDTDIFMFLKNHPLAKKKTKKFLMTIAEDCQGNLNRALDQLRGGSSTVINTEKQHRFQMIKQDMLDDPWMMPLRYHENLPKVLAAKETYAKVLPYFCIWDRMMHHIEVDTEIAVDVLAHAICHYTPSKEKIVLDDFTKLLSNLSLQKKNERLMFPTWDHGFPWPHAQIFCLTSKQKWIT